MGRHRTDEEKVRLREQALALRAEGVPRAQILKRLGIGDDLLNSFVSGAPLPDSLARPRAKDEVRAIAVQLRQKGWTYDDIANELGVSKSSCSLWLRDVEVRTEPLDEAEPPTVSTTEAEPLAKPGVADGDLREAARDLRRQGLLLKEIAATLDVSVQSAWRWTKGIPVPERGKHGRSAEECRRMQRDRWDRVLAERDAERRALKAASAARVGVLTARELELAAVATYWCEGSKDKEYERRETVTIINSDPSVLLLWVAYLDQLGVAPERRRYSLSIHETADVGAAQQWWAQLLDVSPESFNKTTLKRHNPKTVRKNTGDDYRGCLVIRVVRCVELYRHIEGTWQGMMGGLPPRR